MIVSISEISTSDIGISSNLESLGTKALEYFMYLKKVLKSR